MARSATFTPASIDALRKGKLLDPRTPGLAIEVLPSGKKTWRYERRLAGDGRLIRLTLGRFPAHTMADARAWATSLNDQLEAGIDPREAKRVEEAEQRALKDRASMTIAKAHELYMIAVRDGRSSRAKKRNKPRTIKDKLDIYKLDIAPTLSNRCIHDVTEADLIKLVEAKGRTAKVRANRLAAELKVFFGWAASLRGLEIGLDQDPSRRLGDLRYPETARSRKLGRQELEWFLKALVDEPRHFQRGMLLWLLTAARISEVVRARSDEVVDGVWTIPGVRVKNSIPHSIALGPWGRSLIRSDDEWVFRAPRTNGPRNNSVWYKARDRVLARMIKLSGQSIERFTPHDFRRTARSNTKRLKVDFETAEAMMNHLRSGMERIYDGYELEEEKAAWFLKWEGEIAEIARCAGVARLLGVPNTERPSMSYSISYTLPQRTENQQYYEIPTALATSFRDLDKFAASARPNRLSSELDQFFSRQTTPPCVRHCLASVSDSPAICGDRQQLRRQIPPPEKGEELVDGGPGCRRDCAYQVHPIEPAAS